MSRLYFLLASFLLASLLFAAPASSEEFRGKWWHYYQRGMGYTDEKKLDEALKDLKKAIAMRGKDQRMARTYGMHFIDYFPHRELGIVHLGKGDLDAAIRELELSVRSAESAKAVYYLNAARKAKLSGSGQKPASPITVSFEKPKEPIVTRARSLRIDAQAASEAYVSRVTVNGVNYPVEEAKPKIAVRHEVSLDDDPKEIRIAVEDLAGNRTVGVLPVTVKREGPVLTVYSIVNERRDQKNYARVIGEVHDDLGIQSVRVGGREVKANGARAYTIDLVVERKGAGTLLVQAEDLIGNETVADVNLSGVIAEEIAAQQSESRAALERQAREAAEKERLALAAAEKERAAREAAERDRLARAAAEQEQQARAKAERERAALARAEAGRLAAAAAETARLAALAAESRRQAAEREALLLAAEKIEQARQAREAAERSRLAREKAEQEELGRLKAEAERKQRLAAEKAEAERVLREKAERSRLAAEKAEQERQALEAAERSRLAREQLEQNERLRLQAEAELKALLAAQQAEIERFAREEAERNRGIMEEAEKQRQAREASERMRLAQEKLEQEKLARAKAEAERQARLAAERAEAERVLREEAERSRLAAEKAKQERQAREIAETARLAREKAEQEELARLKAEAEHKVLLAAEKAKAEQAVRAEAERKRLAAEKLEQERLAREAAERSRLAAKKLEQEELARLKAEAQRQVRLAAEKAEAERAAREDAERSRLAAEKAERERLARETAERKRLALEKAAQEELARLKAEAARKAYLAGEQEDAEQRAAEASRKPAASQRAIMVERDKLKAITDEQKLSLALSTDTDKQLTPGMVLSGEGTKIYSPAAVAPGAPGAAASAKRASPAKEAACRKPDNQKPILNIKDPGGIPFVFVDAYPMDGMASDNCLVDRVVVNGREVSIRKGKQVYFSSIVKLASGDNSIAVDVYDDAGNKTSSRMQVSRKVPSVLQNGSRMSVLVLPFDYEASSSASVRLASDYLIGAMAEQRRFMVVERHKLKQLMAERKMSLALAEDNEKAAQFGKIAAAEAIIVNTARETEHSFEVTSRIVDTETSEVMSVLDVYTEDTSAASVKILMTALAAKIARNFPVVEGIVISRDDDRVLTDLGAPQMVRQRTGAIVYRKGKEIKHPSTGKSLGFDTEKLGEGYMDEVQESFSKLRLGDRYRDKGIQPSDLVVTK